MSKGKSLEKRIENLTPTLSLKPTPKIEEGPYYKPGSPEKTSLLEEGVKGAELTLAGYVRDINGRPVSHAWLDFWQADGEGDYDNSSYVLRGHQYTDKSGKYFLKTVVPGGYASRTPHLHVKVRADDRSPILTTQLFIPGLASNKTDFLYREDLEIDMKDAPKGKIATFDFVLKV